MRSRQQKVTSPGSGSVRRACIRKKGCTKHEVGTITYGTPYIILLLMPAAADGGAFDVSAAAASRGRISLSVRLPW
jgi:hypothetical protein